ncbi:hydrogenase expression/formation protein HupG [Marinobacterium zhoushanense]|uniref:Hydrogenase expression/formation protein n=1 Tax=Marinobacterium zhoushanense TaxID=1679163 RepID=A0ABQ1JXW4_9GAMM|nr:hydrogenase [Marinobacterium zhoushanense]GGB78720.1 hydrogenase expression/formation protein HupG [Marinobacterium zhoushanense]
MTHPLLEQLTSRYGYPRLEHESVDAFIEAQPFSVLFFAGNPSRFPESLDVAVILPELLKQFPQLSAALVDPESEHRLQGRYNFNAWPTLVFLKQGRYLGALSRVHNWDEYRREIERILVTEPQRNPGIGIPVVANNASTPCGH